MDFSTLPVGPLDRAVLAAKDFVDQDDYILKSFGGRILGGTASITPDTTTLTGTGTSWLTGADDSLGTGERLRLGWQIATIAEVVSNSEIEIETPHADGLIDEIIAKASRGFRVPDPEAPLDVAAPYWLIGAGGLPGFTPEIGRLNAIAQIQVTFVYENQPGWLNDTDGSWASLLWLLTVLFLEPAAMQLCVPRFGEQRLARRMTDWQADRGGTWKVPAAQGRGEGAGNLATHVVAPTQVMTWEGVDPQSIMNLTQRW